MEAKKRSTFSEDLKKIVQKATIGESKLRPLDDEKRAMLHLAVISKELTLIQQLLSAGANIESKDELGQTPLHCAAVRGNFDTMKVLTFSGADIDASDKMVKNSSLPRYQSW